VPPIITPSPGEGASTFPFLPVVAAAVAVLAILAVLAATGRLPGIGRRP
jgi:hypothetical protein